MRDLMISGINVLGSRVLVKQFRPIKKIGSILLHQSTSNAEEAVMNKGEVVAVGPTAFTSDYFVTYANDNEGALIGSLPDPLIKVGDFVLYNKYAGTQFKIAADGDEFDTYRIVSDRDIMLVFDDLKAARSAKTFYAYDNGVYE